ncbi:hypothetical protein NIES25_13040 [Nostoc linckia NIES-25]|nr:hypothetical protein NIES25_13040 [Nostoc linckia NIES-25]
MEILEISALGNLMAGQTHEINHFLVLIAGKLQPTQDDTNLKKECDRYRRSNPCDI